jgi:hypothetical protein
VGLVSFPSNLPGIKPQFSGLSERPHLLTIGF